MNGVATYPVVSRSGASSLFLLSKVEAAMSAGFTKISSNVATSVEGFTVRWRPAGGIDYSDDHGTIRIDSELLIHPTRIFVYAGSGGLRKMPNNRAEDILANIIKALEFLGHRVERE
jgi:hypothetical protein